MCDCREAVEVLHWHDMSTCSGGRERHYNCMICIRDLCWCCSHTQTHGFCPRCGGDTMPIETGLRRRCLREASHKLYPRTDPVVRERGGGWERRVTFSEEQG